MIDEKWLSVLRQGASCAVIVAHPDDETLWAGGLMLMHPQVQWTIVTMCRRSDLDRSRKFFNCVEEFKAAGIMGDLDDGPEQKPLDEEIVEQTVVRLLPGKRYDLVLTHDIKGEYTRHLRHEETAGAVFSLWRAGELQAGQVWSFAYQDGGGRYLPRAVENADMHIILPEEIWQKKFEIMTKLYGFGDGSFEAKTTPRQEAFWCFSK